MATAVAALFICGCNGKEKKTVEPAAPVAAVDTVPEPVEKPKPKLQDKDQWHNHVHIIQPDTMPILLDSIIAEELSCSNDSMQLRILSIGNSFSRDAFSYVPFILNELMPGLNLQMTIMYYGGRPLKDHHNALSTGAEEYQRDTYTTEQGKWITEHKNALPTELDSLRQWDLIIFQQASGSSPIYSTYQPYLHALIDKARTNHPDAKVGWLLTPAHPDGYKKMPTATSNDMWELICDVAEQIEQEERFDVVFPGGTAIQNARQTHLDSLGIFGHMSADGLHLQEGLPCLIEAYTIAQKLMNLYNMPHNILFSSLRPTQKWAKERNIPEMNGTVIEGSIEDYDLCKRIALRAIAQPYSLYIHVEQPDSLQQTATDSLNRKEEILPETTE